jgi:hypothetical protein
LNLYAVNCAICHLFCGQGFFFKFAAVDFELPDCFKVDFEVVADFVDGSGLGLFKADFGSSGFGG